MALPKDKTSSLTKKRLDDLFYIEPSNGSIVWKFVPGTRGKRDLVGKEAGDPNHRFGYTTICIDGRDYKRHRIIWFYVHGVWPKEDLDHIDGDRKNDRIDNLREASRSNNCWNSAIPTNNTSGHKGVSWSKSKKRWLAYIATYNKRHHVGYFRTLEEAVAARRAAELFYHGEFATDARNAVFVNRP